MKRVPLAAALAAFFILLVWSVSVRQAVLFLVGIGYGAVLAGARFGFTTGWRNLVEQRDPRGVYGQLLLLALAAILAMPLLGHFTELHAALGPPSVSLLVGAFVFGLTMQIADGCGSGTLYKAGLGVPLNMAILPLFAIGSFLGSVQMHDWLSLGQLEPVGLVQAWGLGPALAATLVSLAVIAVVVRVWVGSGKALFEETLGLGRDRAGRAGDDQPRDRRPAVGRGVRLRAVGRQGRAGARHLRSRAEPVLGRCGQRTAPGPVRAAGRDVDHEHRPARGALWVATRKPPSGKPLTPLQWTIGLAAGFVMGYSSRLGFGCNVGAMFSGISTGSVHGWIWLVMAFLGTLIGLRVRRRFAF
jgi:uncharacterized protein